MNLNSSNERLIYSAQLSIDETPPRVVEKARRTVSQWARDRDEEAELVAMLGLED